MLIQISEYRIIGIPYKISNVCMNHSEKQLKNYLNEKKQTYVLPPRKKSNHCFNNVFNI